MVTTNFLDTFQDTFLLWCMIVWHFLRSSKKGLTSYSHCIKLVFNLLSTAYGTIYSCPRHIPWPVQMSYFLTTFQSTFSAKPCKECRCGQARRDRPCQQKNCYTIVTLNFKFLHACGVHSPSQDWRSVLEFICLHYLCCCSAGQTGLLRHVVWCMKYTWKRHVAFWVSMRDKRWILVKRFCP